MRKFFVLAIFLILSCARVFADFQVAKVLYNVPASTGTNSVTGLTFQPKAMIAYWTLLTADGSGSEYNIGIGFAANDSGTIEQSSMAHSEANQPATNNNCHGSQSNLKVFYHEDSSGTLRLSAVVTSFNADGITFTWSTVTSGVDIHIVFLGGSDITNVFVGTRAKTTTAAPIDQDITAPGFQPDLLILAQQFSITDENTTDGTSSHEFSLGFASSSSARFVASNSFFNSGFTVKHSQLSNAIAHLHQGADVALGDMTTFLPTGFRVNWSVNDPVSRRMNFLCVKGGRYAVGTFNQATVTGNQSVSGLSFQPVGTMFVTVGDVTSGAINNAARMSIGFGASSTSRGCIWAGYFTSQFANSDTASTRVIRGMTEGSAGAPTFQASADYVSNNVTGFTVNNVIADATSREVGYLAFGPSATVAAPIFLLSIDQD